MAVKMPTSCDNIQYDVKYDDKSCIQFRTQEGVHRIGINLYESNKTKAGYWISGIYDDSIVNKTIDSIKSITFDTLYDTLYDNPHTNVITCGKYVKLDSNYELLGRNSHKITTSDLEDDWTTRILCNDSYVRVKGVEVVFDDGTFIVIIMWCIGNGFYKRDFLIDIHNDFLEYHESGEL